MTEFHLVGIGTVCQSKNLMSETNAKKRQVLFDFLDHFDCRRHALRISRPVRQHHAIRLESQNLFCRRIVRNDDRIAVTLCKFAQNAVLCAEIYQNDVALAARVWIRTLGRNLCHDLIADYGSMKLVECMLQIINRINQTALHCPMNTQLLGQRARIDSFYSRDIHLFQEIIERILLAPAVGNACDFATNDAATVGLKRFVIIKVDAVVSDQRISENQNLVCKRLIRHCFLITGHPGRKYDFACRLAIGSKCLAFIDRAVF